MAERETESDDKDHAGTPRRDDQGKIAGDPGVGGLLADPLEPKPEPDAGGLGHRPATPDPDAPRAHGDWAPNRAWRGGRGKR